MGRPENDLQHSIVKALRATGCLVFVTSEIGIGGFGDLLIRPHWLKGAGLWIMCEIKLPVKSSKLREKQGNLYALGATVVVRSVEDALKLVEAYPVEEEL